MMLLKRKKATQKFMNKTIIEYERLRHKDNENLFVAIDNFVRSNNDTLQFLKLGRDKQGDFIQAQNYVGIIQTKSGDTLEILPKIHNINDSIESSKAILLKMLKTLKNHPFKMLDIANLKHENLPLLEIFISMFLDELSRLVKKGIKSDYIELSDNLKFLKGKLNIAQQIRQNSIHKERFYVTYQEFSANRIENRLIKSTLKFLYKRSKFARNQQRIREYMFIFDEVSSSSDIKGDFKNLRLDRQMKHYERVLLWAKIFLQHKSFSPYKGNDIAFALLFDMNKVFESYVAFMLRKNGFNIQTQVCKHYLLKYNNKDKFGLKPDIVFDSNIIADTKWKILSNIDDTAQPDLYQLYAYGKKYDCDKLYLIYPKIKDLKQTPMKFMYDDIMSLEVLYFDLEHNDKNDLFFRPFLTY